MKHGFMMMLVPVAMVITSGCQTTVPIKAGAMQRISEPKPKSLCVLTEATDARKKKSDHVGRQTFSLFMIPTFSVQSDDPLGKEVGKVFSEALNQSGYEVNPVATLDEADGPVLAIQVDSCRNYLFAWVWPLGLTGGRSKLTPIVFGGTGKVLWKGEPCVAWGGCPSLVYMAGFETTIKQEMTSIMRQVVAQLNNPEFVKAISTASGEG